MEADDLADGPTEPDAVAQDEFAAVIEEAVERGIRRAIGSKPHDTAVSSAGQRKEASCRDDETKKRGSLDPRGSRAENFGASRSSRRKPLARRIEELTATIETRLMRSK
jgi:hypothetical protein